MSVWYQWVDVGKGSADTFRRSHETFAVIRRLDQASPRSTINWGRGPKAAFIQ